MRSFVAPVQVGKTHQYCNESGWAGHAIDGAWLGVDTIMNEWDVWKQWRWWLDIEFLSRENVAPQIPWNVCKRMSRDAIQGWSSRLQFISRCRARLIIFGIEIYFREGEYRQRVVTDIMDIVV